MGGLNYIILSIGVVVVVVVVVVECDGNLVELVSLGGLRGCGEIINCWLL